MSVSGAVTNQEKIIRQKKLGKALLIIGVIPFVLLVIGALYGAFAGVSYGFFGDQTKHYGIEPFLLAIILYFAEFLPLFIAMIVMIIVGVCLILSAKNKEQKLK